MRIANTEEHADHDADGASDGSNRDRMTNGGAWIVNGGGRTLGYSIRAMKKTGAAVAEATSLTAQSFKASAEAAEGLLFSALRLFPIQITVGDRLRTRKRIRRLQKEISRLGEKTQRRTAAAQRDGKANSPDDAEAQNLSEAIRLREAEIAELREKLKAESARKGARDAPKKANRKTKPLVPAPAVSKSQATDVRASMSEPPEIKSTVTKPRKRKALFARVPKIKKARRTTEQLWPALEAAAEKAQFSLASEKVIFRQAVRMMQDKSPYVVREVIDSLEEIDHPVVIQALELLAGDSRAEVRAHTLTALAERQEEKALHLFKKATNDRSARVRMAALRGLYKLGHAGAGPYLIKALEDDSAGVRRRAVTCLAWADAQEALPNLLSLLEDPETVVRKAVIEALGNLHNALAVPGLVRALDDEEVSIRQAAHRALENLTSRNIDYNPQAPREDRVRNKAQWEAWWKVNGPELQLTGNLGRVR